MNPNTLIFVAGHFGDGGQPGRHADHDHAACRTAAPRPIPNWGENLFEAGANPLSIPKDRLVFSPHTYGPSVFVQKMFMDPAQPACTGLEGDAAGDARLQHRHQPDAAAVRAGKSTSAISRTRATAWWSASSAATSTGRGGQASIRDRNRWSYITPGTDAAVAERLRGLPGLEGHRRLLLVDQSGIRRHRRLVWPCLRPGHQHGGLGSVAHLRSAQDESAEQTLG